MTAHDWRVRIGDMLEAIDKIGRYTAGYTLQRVSEPLENSREISACAGEARRTSSDRRR